MSTDAVRLEMLAVETAPKGLQPPNPPSRVKTNAAILLQSGERVYV